MGHKIPLVTCTHENILNKSNVLFLKMHIHIFSFCMSNDTNFKELGELLRDMKMESYLKENKHFLK